jgi:hypothetical protein
MLVLSPALLPAGVIAALAPPMPAATQAASMLPLAPTLHLFTMGTLFFPLLRSQQCYGRDSRSSFNIMIAPLCYSDAAS